MPPAGEEEVLELRIRCSNPKLDVKRRFKKWAANFEDYEEALDVALRICEEAERVKDEVGLDFDSLINHLRSLRTAPVRTFEGAGEERKK